MNKENLGVIEVHRKNGIEKRRITDGHFSIDDFNGKIRVNFWVYTVDAIISGPEDTGQSEVIFEVKFPLDNIPKFTNKWFYNYPEHNTIPEGNFGESKEEFYDNYYYNEHDSLKRMVISILKGNEDKYEIEVNGFGLDPWDAKETKYLIKAKLTLSDEMKGYWIK